ncbi:MAG: zinc-dependent metalloprotease, partial [Solirubrobacterales bacterium]
AGDGPRGACATPGKVADSAKRAADSVVDYTGLEPAGLIPVGESIGRDEWVRVNVGTLRETAAIITREAADEPPGALAGAARSVGATIVGAEAGGVLGFAAQRVLGQFDVSLVGAPRASRLLFVAPNIAGGAGRLGYGEELLDWIAIHEVTHAVQFGATPWLRGHLAGQLEQLLRASDARGIASNLLDAAKSAVARDPRELLSGVRSFDPIGSLLGPEQAAVLAQIQAAMSVVEGYADLVMDEAGLRAGLDTHGLRAAFDERRRSRGPLETLLARILGLELKLRQYREGRRFADRVAGQGGIGLLNRLWSAPEALPDPDELERPELWISRVAE